MSDSSFRLAGAVRVLPSLAVPAVAGVLLAGCADENVASLALRSAAPIPEKTRKLIADKDMTTNAPIMIRSFKKESELEIWKQTRSGEYALLKTYPICRWSGQLGPKVREGDRQAPEGFYSITPASLNPNSRLYLSFDMNYPNAYDRALGRSGAFLMVHGACSSAGCYSMSDEQMLEIYALLRESFAGGQSSVQMQALPFRMNAENLARYRLDPNASFWRNLKEGNDRFEVAKRPPRVGVCGKHYVFDAKTKDPMAKLDPAQPCPALDTSDPTDGLVAAKAAADDKAVAELVSAGTPAVRLVYRDGSQHQSFREALANRTMSESRLYAGTASEYRFVSRPEALVAEPQEVPVGLPTAPKGSTLAAAKPTAGPTAPTLAATTPIIAAATVTTAFPMPQPKPEMTTASIRTSATAGRPAAAPAAAPAPVEQPPAEKSMYEKMLSWTGLGRV